MRYRVVWCLLLGMAAGIAVTSGYVLYHNLFHRNIPIDKVHTLKAPMLFGNSTNSGYFMLPVGTTLYFDEAMDEGFSRYRLYINVFGTALPLENINPPGAINPIDLYQIKKEDLLEMMKSIKLNKEDLASILDNGSFSDSEKKDALEFLRQQTK